MNLQKKMISIALAGTVLLGMAGAAMAAQAVATGNVNVRSGPGTGYGAIDVLARGQVVDVTSCRGSWCFVEKPGPDGWVSSSYLGGVSSSPSYSSKPSVGFSFSFGNVPAPSRPAPRPSYGWDHHDGRGGWDRYDDRGGRGDWDRYDRDDRDGWYR
ncbi:SH3 domain-containing protein [Devosia beringensis]|uniref:SH3 domain-containing protein n=1 Tax=Devosia beringensis TaxID=2657486 RepID=UPI00186B72D0|nr:SH3 domain-containing protein [Devosia beringensis]